MHSHWFGSAPTLPRFSCACQQISSNVPTPYESPRHAKQGQLCNSNSFTKALVRWPLQRTRSLITMYWLPAFQSFAGCAASLSCAPLTNVLPFCMLCKSLWAWAQKSKHAVTPENGRPSFRPSRHSGALCSYSIWKIKASVWMGTYLGIRNS